MLLLMFVSAMLAATPRQAEEVKTEYVINVGRMNPQVSGLLMQVDNAFQLKCGRLLTLPELRQIHQSNAFSQLILVSPVGLTRISRQLGDEFAMFPCNKKGA